MSSRDFVRLLFLVTGIYCSVRHLHDFVSVLQMNEYSVPKNVPFAVGIAVYLLPLILSLWVLVFPGVLARHVAVKGPALSPASLCAAGLALLGVVHLIDLSADLPLGAGVWDWGIVAMRVLLCLILILKARAWGTAWAARRAATTDLPPRSPVA